MGHELPQDMGGLERRPRHRHREGGAQLRVDVVGDVERGVPLEPRDVGEVVHPWVAGVVDDEVEVRVRERRRLEVVQAAVLLVEPDDGEPLMDAEGLDAELACLLIHRVGDLDVVEVPPAVVAAARAGTRPR